ncbi:MAG TPA: hypothetical protein DHW66_06685 [Alteromonas sp.]|nr:hypothetical protein [Alteromonadaceae bacterium]HCL11866.1 hypothetical protein [Alteromonas sp.]|tara:strand:- start:8662 stop:8895 length:234 start_codon:yes stop_codon:yes gene_type:complete
MIKSFTVHHLKKFDHMINIFYFLNLFSPFLYIIQPIITLKSQFNFQTANLKPIKLQLLRNHLSHFFNLWHSGCFSIS